MTYCWKCSCGSVLETPSLEAPHCDLCEDMNPCMASYMVRDYRAEAVNVAPVR